MNNELRQRFANYLLGIGLGLAILGAGAVVAQFAYSQPQGKPELEGVPQLPPPFGNNVVTHSSGRYTIVEYNNPETAVKGISQMAENGFERRDCYVWRNTLTCLYFRP